MTRRRFASRPSAALRHRACPARHSGPERRLVLTPAHFSSILMYQLRVPVPEWEGQHLWHRRRREPAMDQICLVVPVLPGRTADARDFMRELEAGRNAGYQASERRIGIVKEAWYLARAGAGDHLIA